MLIKTLYNISSVRNSAAADDRARGHFITKTQPAVTFDTEISDRDVCPSYARVTDCRLARLFLKGTHERSVVVVSFALSRLPHASASLGMCPFRKRAGTISFRVSWIFDVSLRYSEQETISRKRSSILCKAPRGDIFSEVSRRQAILFLSPFLSV